MPDAALNLGVTDWLTNFYRGLVEHPFVNGVLPHLLTVAGVLLALFAIARLMSDRYLEFDMKTDKEGKGVFGSVTKEMILKGLRDAGFIRKEHVEIKLDHPLKELGEHMIEVDLKKGITARLKIVLRAQKS